MDSDALIAYLDGLRTAAENHLVELVQPWRLYQLGFLVGAFLVAHLADRLLERRMDAWMRGLVNVPKARLRFLVLVNRHLRSLIFLALAWGGVLVVRAITLALLIAVAGWASTLVKSRVDSVEDMSPSMKVLTDKLFRLVVYGAAVVSRSALI